MSMPPGTGKASKMVTCPLQADNGGGEARGRPDDGYFGTRATAFLTGREPLRL